MYRYELLAGETFGYGSLVVKDGSDRVYEVTGTDPTPLLGVATEDALAVVEPGYTPVYVFDTDEVVFRMQGDRAPVAGDIGQDYGIAQDSDGIWIVDTTDTSNTRVTVQDVDTVVELYFVKVMAAHRQSA